MDDWDVDLTDGIDPLEYYLLEEVILKDEEETNSGCLGVLLFLILFCVLFKELIT